MKILMLESSGNKNGSSNMLAKEFIRGAEENGNAITEFDVIHAHIRPCLGCNHCGMDGPCVQRDDYENTLKTLIREADMLVFVMPVYYYNWPAQQKNSERTGLFSRYTMHELLDELDVIECFTEPGKAPIQGKVLKKQEQLYRDLGVEPLLAKSEIAQ